MTTNTEQMRSRGDYGLTFKVKLSKVCPVGIFIEVSGILFTQESKIYLFEIIQSPLKRSKRGL